MLETQSLSAQSLRVLFTKSHPPEKTGFPCGATVKNLPGMQEKWVDPWVGEIPWRMVWKSAPVFLPEKSHGCWGPAGYSLWGCKQLDTPEWLSILKGSLLLWDCLLKPLLSSVFWERTRRCIANISIYFLGKK